MNKLSFDQLTNLYTISKTLRFELKPVGNTDKMLMENNVFQIDENRKKAYENTKPYFDRLHREFVAESLETVQLEGLEEYYADFKEYKVNKNNNDLLKNVDTQRNKLRKQITKYFDLKGKEWANNTYAHLMFKKKDLNILFEEQVFSLLKNKYGDEEKAIYIDVTTGEVKSIFDDWKGFVSYFDKFFATRKNFYKDDGTVTALATRMVDQNLERFFDNITNFQALKDKLDLSGVGELFGLKISDVFSISFYNKCLLQDGIDSYNKFLGAINEIINRHRQDNKEARLPFLKKLDKQILSERESNFFLLDNDKDAVELLRKFQVDAESKLSTLNKLVNKFFTQSSNFNLERIYLAKEALNTISYKWVSESSLFQESLYKLLKEQKLVKPKGKGEEEYSFPDFIALSYIKASLNEITVETRIWKDVYYENATISLEEDHWRGFLKILETEFNINFALFSKNNLALKNSLNDTDVNLQAIKPIIKDFADSALWTYQLGKYFAVEKKRKWEEVYELDDFYTDPIIGYKEQYYPDAYEQILKPYNDIRNYLTRKPYSQEKWKLNFENPTLADGWDKNKESDNSTVILRKDGRYYLALMRKGSNKVFDERNMGKFTPNIETGFYEKLVYKYLPDAAKMIPKCSTQLKNVTKHFQSNSEDILINGKSFTSPLKLSKRIYELNNITFDKSNIDRIAINKEGGVKQFQKDYLNLSKNSTIYKAALSDWIDFCKDFLSKYDSTKDYNLTILKDTDKYESLDEFYKDIDSATYSTSFIKISKEYVTNANNSGEIYLFEIYNQDFSQGKTGKKNLHTIYFEELFSKENADNNFVFKLNGQAEVFFRPGSIDKVEESRNLKRKVIKNKRYSENKIFFHVPITLNRISKNVSKFNLEVNNFIANNPDINIIGVDRGEKHLAYYSVVDQSGKILDSGSLNTIQNLNEQGIIILKNGKKIEEVHNEEGNTINYKIVNTGEKVNEEDYKLLLEYKEKVRKIQRQSWESVENIKDLKKGYISQVVRKLADLAIEYNAIIVMEDLNIRFKQIRGGIERSIYQQLEKALIDKLSFLVDKSEIDPNKAGHLLKAYQLAKPVDSFSDMGKQTGIIFYTQAAYTSKIDPLTGWRPNLYLKYANAKSAKKDVLSFTNIEYNKQEDRFEFTYDIKKFVEAKEYPNKTEWTLTSSVERYRWDRKLNNSKGSYTHYKDLTVNFENLFTEFGVEINSNIKNQIEALDTEKNAKFFKEFIYLFNLVCQIRNTNPNKDGDENDFILSPVEPFFDSRKSTLFGGNLPQNGDDNGAYNIARKGIITLRKISEFKKNNKDLGKLGWRDLSISPVEWDNFTRGEDK